MSCKPQSSNEWHTAFSRSFQSLRYDSDYVKNSIDTLEDSESHLQQSSLQNARRCHHSKDQLFFFSQMCILWVFICFPVNVVTFILCYQSDSPTAPFSVGANLSFEESLCPSSLTNISSSIWCKLACQNETLRQCFVKFPQLQNQPCCEETSNSSSSKEISPNYSCYESHQDYQHFLDLSSFWLQGVTMTVIGVFGLIGNITTLYVLPQIKSNRSFHKMLFCLIIIDSTVIVFFVGDVSIIGQFLSPEPYIYRVAYPYLIHPFRNMALTASIFMVVAISAERYRAICYPLKYRPAYSKYICFVMVTTVCLEIPRFFEFKLISLPDSTITYWTTSLMANETYIQFTSYWDDIITTGILPFSGLVFFNSCIYLNIRKSFFQKFCFVDKNLSEGSRFLSPECQTLQVSKVIEEANRSVHRTLVTKDLSRKDQGESRRHFKRRKEKTVVLLISIVLVFVVCHAFRLVVQIYDISLSAHVTEAHFLHCHSQDRFHVPVFFRFLLIAMHIFIIINSSVNFILYCLVAKDFRKRFFLMFHFRRPKLTRSSTFT